MIIPSGDRSVERISLTEAETKYTIKATGKAFKILSSGLYKDKILAIVREISCNAYDAHVSVGKKDVPFEVKLPNAMEPFFSIRDKGPSLSPNSLLSVFSRYFESTKTETNDQIGGFGLGSKTPFSYVDSYTVIARLDGIKRTYTCFYDETDTPTIALMSEEETDEETGLEVIVPVKNYDFRSFREKAEQVYAYFNPRPVVIGDAEFKIKERTPLIVGRGYKIYNKENRGHYQGAKAVMGIVAYPIEGSLVDDLSSSERSFLNLPIDIEFNIGEISVTAGREEISYETPTKAAIVKRTREVMADVSRRIFKMFKECKNEFEARVLWASLNNVGYQVFNGFKDGAVPYRDMLISSNTFEIKMKQEFPGLRIMNYRSYGYGKSLTRHDVLDGHTFGNHGSTTSLHIAATSKLTFIIDDDNGKYISNKVRAYRESNGGDSVMLLRNTEIPVAPKLPGADGGAESEAVVLETVEPDTTDYVQKFVKLLAGAKFIKLSEMEKEEAEPRTPTRTSVQSDYGKSVNSFSRHHLTQLGSPDVQAGGIYIKTVSGRFQWGDGTISTSDLESVYKRAKLLKIIDDKEDIHIIPKTLVEPYEGSDAWATFYDVVKDNVSKLVYDKDWYTQMAANQCTDRFIAENYSFGGAMSFTKSVKNQLDEAHPLHNIFSTWIASEKESENFSAQVYLADKVGIEIDIKVQDIISSWNETFNRYPLVHLIFRNIRYERQDGIAKQVVEYISAIDKLKLQNTGQ